MELAAFFYSPVAYIVLCFFLALSGFNLYAMVNALNRGSVDVTLVDRRNFHLFQPLTYQVATGALSQGEVAFSLRALFHRAKNVRDRVRGSGVGLASVRQIVTQHGGKILVDSEEGKGSTFTVILPFEPSMDDEEED